jgi:SAM-dependent methyltransferase
MTGLTRLFGRRRRSVSPSFAWQRTPPPVFFDSDGRRRRTDVPYLLPKDEKELQRLDYQHFLLRQVSGGNTFAPVHDRLTQGGNVLDVGCGTGRWCQEVAQNYPRSVVWGLDLEQVMPASSTPARYQFVQGNLLEGLPFAPGLFTYTHQRLLVAAIPLTRWPWVIGELRRVTAAGGWVELVEMGTTFHHSGPATRQLLAWWTALSASRGIDASQMGQIGTWLKEAGLSHVRSQTRRLAVGSWGGRLGTLLAQDMLAGWPAIRSLVEQRAGVTAEEFERVLAALEEEWNQSQTRYEVYFACGQVV